jgi:hypothetical protein
MITQQRGKPHSCNANKRKYARLGILGIGMIHRNDEAACMNAINAVGYLAEPEKEDQFLRMKPEGRRSFGTGMFERSKATRTWREAAAISRFRGQAFGVVVTARVATAAWSHSSIRAA